jgi:HPt (histidine-containing phosphotransfer) domain-containing protein
MHKRRVKYMTLQECYESMGADYEGVSGRLLSDDRIRKYLLKFLGTTDYQIMLEALGNKDYELAFRMAHNLKGVSLNLGLTGLQTSSASLCEALRGGKPEIDITSLLESVKEEYQKVVSSINQL